VEVGHNNSICDLLLELCQSQKVYGKKGHAVLLPNLSGTLVSPEPTRMHAEMARVFGSHH
jgi:hypothetical protein